jgi:hypothetical protein
MHNYGKQKNAIIKFIKYFYIQEYEIWYVVIGITKYSVKKVLNDKFKNISLS